MVVRELLAADGVDINQARGDGQTPLYTASELGHGDVVRELLAVESVGVNQAEKTGMTPLLMASQMGHVELVDVLLQHGAVPDPPTVRVKHLLHDSRTRTTHSHQSHSVPLT